MVWLGVSPLVPVSTWPSLSTTSCRKFIFGSNWSNQVWFLFLDVTWLALKSCMCPLKINCGRSNYRWYVWGTNVWERQLEPIKCNFYSMTWPGCLWSLVCVLSTWIVVEVIITAMYEVLICVKEAVKPLLLMPPRRRLRPLIVPLVFNFWFCAASKLRVVDTQPLACSHLNAPNVSLYHYRKPV